MISAKRTPRFVPVLALVAALFSGCTNDEDSIILILHDAVPDSAECNYTATGVTHYFNGTVDVSLSSGYIMHPRLEHVGPSSLTVGTKDGSPNQTPENLNLEGNRATMKSAELSYEFLGGGFSLPSVVVPITGSMDPGGSVVTAITMLNSDQLSSIGVPAGGSVLVNVTIQLSGVTSSNTSIVSNIFTYPIELCSNCIAAETACEEYRCSAPLNLAAQSACVALAATP